MMLLQFDLERASYLAVVVETDNLERMELGDPITFNPSIHGGMLRPITYPANLHLLVAYEKDTGPLYAMAQAGRTRELLAHIMRGYEFKANDGKRAAPGTGGHA
jgi:hypothetical protein